MPPRGINPTALGLALKIAKAQYDPLLSTLVPEAASDMSASLVEAVAPGSSARRRKPPGFFARLRNRLRGVNLNAHIAIRKRFVEETARAAIAAGAGQVVVLGAGLDTLAARLHREHPDGLFIEIDRPGSLEIKARVLKAREAQGPNLILRPGDLLKIPLPDLLAGCDGFDPDEETLFIAEGLFVYFREEHVEKLLHAAAGASRVTRFLFSFFPSRIQSRNEQGERFRWFASAGSLEKLLERAGLKLERVIDPVELWTRYLPDTPVKAWRQEWFAQAVRA